MSNTPIKQIYLLLIIIVGIISLSVYSTYALFTYEKETGDIISINTLSILSIDTDIIEYKRILAKHNSLTTIDIDVNNSLSNNLCYGIWYSVIDGNVSVYKYNNDSMTSGFLDGLSNRKVSIIIINTNDNDLYVNIGVNSSSSDECVLNLDSNKHLITDIYEPKYLNDYIIKNILEEELEKDSEYGEISNYLIDREDDSIMVSSSFEFDNGVFTLIEPSLVKIVDMKDDELYYFMINDNNREIYRIDSISSDKINTTRIVGFIDSINGMIKYDDNIEYYGANPDNYICFNDGISECDLYRIVGVFYDKENKKYNVKIVRNDYLDKDQYSLVDNNLISDEVNSNIYDKLNEYYDKLPDDIKEYIMEYEYKNDYNDELDMELMDIYNYESKNNYKLYVGMLSLSDYLYASNCNDKKVLEYGDDCYINNWLYKYDKEMLITRLDINDEKIYAVGDKLYQEKFDSVLNMRPVIYLNSDIVIIKGNGSISNPFIIGR